MSAPNIWFAALIAVALGGCIGSFLNVVVYRLPRGMSLSHPGSRCPKCGAAIRWYHNIPVLGWLFLRGRCYDCKAAISARYPLVEAAVAAIFLVLAIVGPIAGGWNLPLSPALSHGELWGLAAYHALLLCTLLAATLIELDAANDGTIKISRRLWLGPLAVALAAPAIWPWLHPLTPRLIDNVSFNSVAAGLAGVVAAVLCCVILQPASGFGPLGSAGRPIVAANLSLVGAILGWESVLAIAAATTILYFFLAVAARAGATQRHPPWSIPLVPVVLGCIVFWRPLAELPLATMGDSPWPIAFIPLGALAAASLLIGVSASRRS